MCVQNAERPLRTQPQNYWNYLAIGLFHREQPTKVGVVNVAVSHSVKKPDIRAFLFWAITHDK